MDTLINVISYLLPALLVIWYLFYLVTNHRKNSFVFGRQKKMIRILSSSQYVGIKSNHTKRIADLLGEIKQLFYKDGEVDYNEMLIELGKLRSTELHNTEERNLIPQIDILTTTINEKYKFYRVSAESAEIFERISRSLDNGDVNTAQSDLELLYIKCRDTESNLKKRGKKEFWIGTSIGLLGILVSIFLSYFK